LIQQCLKGAKYVTEMRLQRNPILLSFISKYYTLAADTSQSWPK